MLWRRERGRADRSDEPRVSREQAAAMVAAGHQADTVAALMRGRRIGGRS